MKNLIKNIKIYEYGKQPNVFNLIKLNSNENSFFPEIKIIKNLIKEIKFFGNSLRFYPDASSYITRTIIAKYYNLKINQIILSNGSDEILNYIFIFLKKNKKKLALNNITYVFYESYIRLYEIKYIILNLKKNFSIKINFYKNNVYNILITNPNANTGKILLNANIKLILKKNLSSIIIFDEAYIDFSYENNINLVKLYKNLILIKTISKSRSLASLRIGLAIGNKNLILLLNKIKNSINTYPINTLSQKLTNYLFKNNYYFNKNKNKILNNKKKFKKLLKYLNFKNIITMSNFILIKTKKVNINKLVKFLNKKNILIRKFENPTLENFVRITIGLKKESLKLFYKIYKLNFNYFK